MPTGSKSKGFTMIELAIVMLVVAILAAIAYPSYQDSILKSRRADAKELLLRTAQAQERHFTQFAQYAPNLGVAPNPALAPQFLGLAPQNLISDGGFYNITVVAAGAIFTLSANDTLGGDAFCGNFTLTQTGARNTSVPANALACW